MLTHSARGPGDFAERILWPQLLRKVERIYPDYKQ
jgi:hypothetical protein